MGKLYLILVIAFRHAAIMAFNQIFVAGSHAVVIFKQSFQIDFTAIFVPKLIRKPGRFFVFG